VSGTEETFVIVMGIVAILSAVGGFCIGYLSQNRRVLKWRIRWIRHEHDLARLQDRRPRNIDEFDHLDRG